ncbi:MAG: hypothetical protein JW993_11565 [Sedimentisphaerales bacterium]|nr:hypothetical protein [Sedimentisphaerales bacterium]
MAKGRQERHGLPDNEDVQVAPQPVTEGEGSRFVAPALAFLEMAVKRG